MSRVIVYLENMWVRDPERMKRVRDRVIKEDGLPGWDDYTKRLLFMGCTTGKRLTSAWGDILDHENLIFAETTSEIAGSPNEKFPPNHQYMMETHRRLRPVSLTIGLGKTAKRGIELFDGEFEYVPHNYVFGPHPAARQGSVLAELKAILPRIVEVLK